MKNFIFLLVLLAAASFPQKQTVPDFLVSGEDNESATFVQNSPQIFYTNSNNFIVSWTDYHEGEPAIYTQLFDNSGDKIGNNYKVHSNRVYYKDDSYSLELKETNSYLFDDTYYTIDAFLYNELKQEITTKPIASGIYPWCGTGYISGEKTISSSGDGFYYLDNEGGRAVLVKIKDDGTIITFEHPDDMDYYSTSAAGVTGAATKNSNYFYAWSGSMAMQDSMEFGLYAKFINDKDSVIIPRLKITSFWKGSDPDGVYSNIYRFTLRSIALNDSTYKLFWIDHNLGKLYSVKLNVDGDIISTVDSMDISQTDGYNWGGNIALTNLNTDGFYLIIKNYENNNYENYEYTLSKFDVNGNMIESYEKQSGVFISVQNLFYAGNDQFYSCSSDGNDVFLNKQHVFDILESTKINDDEFARNQLNKSLTRYDDNTVFAAWSDEKDSYGVKIDKNGNIIGSQVNLESTNISFFPDNEAVSAWVKAGDGSSYNAGFTIYDKDFNKKNGHVLTTEENSSDLSVSINIVSESEVIFCLNNSGYTKIIKVSDDGSILKQITVNARYCKIYKRDNNSFWVHSGRQLWLFSNNLEQAGTEKTLPYVDYYLGGDKFLSVYTAYNYYSTTSYLGAVINSEGDTLKSGIYLKAYKQSESGPALISNINDNEFIVINKSPRGFYARAYTTEGFAGKDSFYISSKSQEVVSNPAFIVNDGKIFFTWSDSRNEGKGYDVYGSIYDLSSITDVKQVISEVPENYTLSQNYPNPFNPSTRIRFSVPEYSHVFITIYDILGNEVSTIVNEEKNSGVYETEFNAANLASGIYYYKISAGNYTETRKMLLLK